jgi:hypothetical protein
LSHQLGAKLVFLPHYPSRSAALRPERREFGESSPQSRLGPLGLGQRRLERRLLPKTGDRPMPDAAFFVAVALDQLLVRAAFDVFRADVHDVALSLTQQPCAANGSVVSTVSK